MSNARVLVVDDEEDLRAELKSLLERTGFEVELAADGEEALQRAAAGGLDLIVLDVVMPHIDGREVLRRLRNRDDWTPVILLTKVGTSGERALTLQEGADDYINKPFDPLELIARIEAVLRRTQLDGPSLATTRYLVSGDLVVDRQAQHVELEEKSIDLTPRAYRVLEYLMLHAGEIVSRKRLLDEVWGWAYAVGTRAVDVRIAELRKALDDDPEVPHYVETVIGQGYRFIGEVEGRT